METFHYDTYCGLYCGACDIMAAFKKASETGKPAAWEDLPLAYRKNLPTGQGLDIVCYGCKSDTVYAGCSKCPVRKCAKATMKVASCHECRKYPCLRFHALNLFQWLLKKRLPHLKTAKPNRVFIKKNGINAWLAQQENAWKCPQCKTPLTWYKKTCSKCVNDLAG
jgi:hypothetical protein